MNIKSVSFGDSPQIKNVERFPKDTNEYKKVSLEEYIKDHYDDKKQELASRGIKYDTPWKESMAVKQWLRLEYRERYGN